MVSVIIPLYNEEEMLSGNARHFKALGSTAELIFVDGGSSDRGAEVAARYGRVVPSQKGRARQMNRGAAAAKGDTLFFLHADAVVSPAAVASIETKLEDNDAIGGCLTQRIDKEGLAYRFIENFGNRRARATGVFYGDQGIFVKKKSFFELGAFPETPLMEDVMFTEKMKRSGRTIVLQDTILVSPRRWEKRGLLRTAAFYSSLNILFRLGAPLAVLKRHYGELR